MKSLACVLGLFVLAACSVGNDSASNVATTDDEELVLKTYTFSKDDRPVDGLLEEMTFVQNAQGKYSVSLRTAFVDRINHKEVDETRVIDGNMSCKFLQGFVPGLVKVTCSHDMRPVDGVLKEVVLSKVEGGRFDATERTAYWNHQTGKEVDETKAIANGLKLMSTIDLPAQPIFCTAIAGVLWNPATESCQGFTNGCQQNAMLEAGYTSVPEGKTCSL